MAITKKAEKIAFNLRIHVNQFLGELGLRQVGVSSGMSIVKAINVIANANTASLNDITYSNLILGVNTLGGIFGITKGKSYPF